MDGVFSSDADIMIDVVKNIDQKRAAYNNKNFFIIKQVGSNRSCKKQNDFDLFNNRSHYKFRR